MKPLKLYAIFHLNLMFSSIEEEQRPEVVRRCYWPLLQLIEKGVPLGIELTGVTLEQVQQIDPAWVNRFIDLLQARRCELIGSGYAQVIGPLVPAAVNRQNQRLGKKTYRDLLQTEPTVALVNEQAWSAGMVEHYRDAGYSAAVMEWDNPAAEHPEWPAGARYRPQQARGANGQCLPIIWNHSISFQKFQRYVHGELTLAEYLPYLASHRADEDRCWTLYCNDAEIFDFRPGRFATETEIEEGVEWQRIEGLFSALGDSGDFRLVLPSTVLDLAEDRCVPLQSAAQPIPVKKQAKYNVNRWAVTGRDDLDMNSRCTALAAVLPPQDTQGWKELCYLWSSDFRTHITARRWTQMKQRLQRLEQKTARPQPSHDAATLTEGPPTGVTVTREGRFLLVETPHLSVKLNLRRGMAIDRFGLQGGPALAGTLEHGFFDHIELGNDYYTGHLVLEAPGAHKLTDLEPIDPSVYTDSDSNLCLTGRLATSLGVMEKTWVFYLDQPAVTLQLNWHWPLLPKGTLRLGHLTLKPQAFDRRSLYYRTVNGGFNAETFALNDRDIDHLRPVSSLVSTRHGVGLTEGWIELGDARHALRLETEQQLSCATGHLHYRSVKDTFFYRAILSLQETDDTCEKKPARTSFSSRTARLTYRVLR